MPYDPRMLQMARTGIGMLGPQANAFGNQQAAPQRPKQWWEQPMPAAPTPQGGGQQQNDPGKPGATPTPSLLQLLMLGGKPTYSGTPTGGAAPSGGNPWGWLGSMGMPGGAGWGGGGSAG